MLLGSRAATLRGKFFGLYVEQPMLFHGHPSSKPSAAAVGSFLYSELVVKPQASHGWPTHISHLTLLLSILTQRFGCSSHSQATGAPLKLPFSQPVAAYGALLLPFASVVTVQAPAALSAVQLASVFGNTDF